MEVSQGDAGKRPCTSAGGVARTQQISTERAMIAILLRCFRRPAVRSALACVGLAAVLLLGRAGPAPLAAEQPRGVAEQPDLRYTLLARQALGRDPALAPLNLGVRVHRRVAVLWGPVPSEALKARAEQVLRQLPDLLDVRNELHVVTPDDPPPQYLPETLPPSSRGPGPSRPFAAPAENVRLKPAPSAGLRDTGGAYSILVPASAPLQLDRAIEALRRQAPRFAGLRAVVSGKQVRLSGTVRQLQDAYDLAAAIARLPGVERVALNDVRSSGN
jgi:hypothetical protein